VLDLYRRALDRYAPSVYQGRTAVFVEVDEEAVACSPWKALVEGADFYPLFAEHMEILEEPHIRTWAEPVGALLDVSPVAPRPEASSARSTGWKAAGNTSQTASGIVGADCQ